MSKSAQSPLIQRAYTTEVMVLVNTETRQIESVTVLDEHLTDLNGEPSFFAEKGDIVAADTPQAKIALEVTDDPEVEWPAWKFGY